MQEDFHYYATYCAAFLAGHSHEESMAIAYSAQFVDCCSRSLIDKLKGPRSAATTQTQIDLAEAGSDPFSLQEMTRIWASFHFLPARLNEKYPKHRSRRWLNKYRMICGPNSDLVSDTVLLAKGSGPEACGLAMHVLADTWAHRYFAGTPSFVINNASHFYESLVENGRRVEKKISFNNNPTSPDDIEQFKYTNSLYQSSETSIMVLGHGRAGHLPDYSFIRYKYLPAWGGYEYLYKDNPSDYYHAFCQMVYAMKFLNGTYEDFQTDRYDWDSMAAYRDTVLAILKKRRLNACADWKAFGESLSGQEIEDFSISKYQKEFQSSDKSHKDDTFLGRFFLAALAQKSLVTYRIFKTGSHLAGFSVDFEKKGLGGDRDYWKLLEKRNLKGKQDILNMDDTQTEGSDREDTP